MENIESLRNIAEYLGLKSIVSELEAIDLRAKQENASLIFFEEKEELFIPNWGKLQKYIININKTYNEKKYLYTANVPHKYDFMGR